MTAGQIAIHFAHRLGAVIVCIAAAWLAFRVFRNHVNVAALLFPTMLVVALLLFQIVLGAVTIFTRMNPYITTLHVANGAGILALGLVTCLHAFRITKPTPNQRRASVEGEASLSRKVAV